MSKGLKISIIIAIVIIIAGVVYLKYIKPKMDERKELKRLKEADIVATATKVANPQAGTEIVKEVINANATPLIGIGGVQVTAI